MTMSWLKESLSRNFRPTANERRRGRVVPTLEPLPTRVMLSVTALFVAEAGQLKVTGDDQDNIITISVGAGGTILVNDGAVPIQGATPTVGNTNHLHIVGAGGNDNISLNEANGALPGAALFGGAGNDTLIGGSGVDFVDGDAGSDTVFMGASDDTFQWNPGNGSDVVDGQGGRDTMVFNGADIAEKIDISANGNRVRFTRDVGTVSMDLDGLEVIDFNAFGGADTITVNDQTATDIFDINLNLSSSGGTGDGEADAVIINGTDGEDFGQIAAFNGGTLIGAFMSLFPFVNITGAEGSNDRLTLNAGGGDDTIDATALPANLIGLILNAGDGKDTMLGSAGNDVVNGGSGDDTAFLDFGDDSFQWNSGDGSDIVEGQGGTDTLNFNGSNDAENIGISANGSRVRVTRDLGSIVMDIDGVEQAAFAALGGADNVTVNNLAGTALAFIKVKLNADGQPDSVTVNGSDGADKIGVEGDFSNGVTVTGLAAQVEVVGAIGVSDGVTVNALGSADTIDASALQAGAITLTLNGGDGADEITSSEGDDLISGGPQTDTINVPSTASDTVVTILPSSGDDAVNVNLDGIGVANVVFDATQRIGQLDINRGGAATLTSGGAKVLTTTGLGIAGGGKLNLTDNDVIVDYTGLSQLSAIQGMLASGRNGGAWNGNGITTSFGNASNFALGFGEASSLFPGGSVSGQPVDTTAVVVKFTFYGDTNLDGQVNVTDLGKLASNWQLAPRSWSAGDFDYDLSVNIADLGLLATNWQAGVGNSLSLGTAPAGRPSKNPFSVRRLSLSELD